jgi:hypothetical protein
MVFRRALLTLLLLDLLLLRAMSFHHFRKKSLFPQTVSEILALYKLVTAEFNYIAQVGKVGLIAEVEFATICNVWAHRTVRYGILFDHFRLLRVGVHVTLQFPELKLLVLCGNVCFVLLIIHIVCQINLC